MCSRPPPSFSPGSSRSPASGSGGSFLRCRRPINELLVFFLAGISDVVLRRRRSCPSGCESKSCRRGRRNLFFRWWVDPIRFGDMALLHPHSHGRGVVETSEFRYFLPGRGPRHPLVADATARHGRRNGGNGHVGRVKIAFAERVGIVRESKFMTTRMITAVDSIERARRPRRARRSTSPSPPMLGWTCSTRATRTSSRRRRRWADFLLVGIHTRRSSSTRSRRAQLPAPRFLNERVHLQGSGAPRARREPRAIPLCTSRASCIGRIDAFRTAQHARGRVWPSPCLSMPPRRRQLGICAPNPSRAAAAVDSGGGVASRPRRPCYWSARTASLCAGNARVLQSPLGRRPDREPRPSGLFSGLRPDERRGRRCCMRRALGRRTLFLFGCPVSGEALRDHPAASLGVAALDCAGSASATASGPGIALTLGAGVTFYGTPTHEQGELSRRCCAASTLVRRVSRPLLSAAAQPTLLGWRTLSVVAGWFRRCRADRGTQSTEQT